MKKKNKSCPLLLNQETNEQITIIDEIIDKLLKENKKKKNQLYIYAKIQKEITKNWKKEMKQQITNPIFGETFLYNKDAKELIDDFEDCIYIKRFY